MDIVLTVAGVAFAGACIRLLVAIVNGRHRDPEFGINWPVVTGYVIYAAIVGMLLVLASSFFPEVRS